MAILSWETESSWRRLSPQKLCSQSRWWNGPVFLWQERENWPTTEVSSIPNDDPEVLTKVKIHVIKTAAVHDNMLSKLITVHGSNYNVIWLGYHALLFGSKPRKWATSGDPWHWKNSITLARFWSCVYRKKLCWRYQSSQKAQQIDTDK